jgi:hypothetical protein
MLALVVLSLKVSPLRFSGATIILLVVDVIPEEFWTGFFATYYVVNI